MEDSREAGVWVEEQVHRQALVSVQADHQKIQGVAGGEELVDLVLDLEVNPAEVWERI